MSASEAKHPDQPLALIIEDDVVWSTILERVLLQLGIRSRVAPDEREARIELNDRQFALILVDLQLPGQEGIELLNDIRSSPALARRAIIVTAFDRIATYFSADIPVVDKSRLHELVPHVNRIMELAFCCATVASVESSLPAQAALGNPDDIDIIRGLGERNEIRDPTRST